MLKPQITWIKGCESAHCVEVGFVEEWKTACEGGACVEVQVLKTKVKIRDSKDPDGPQLSFDMEEWQQFKEGIIRGAFD